MPKFRQTAPNVTLTSLKSGLKPSATYAKLRGAKDVKMNLGMTKPATRKDVDDVLGAVRNLADMTHEHFMTVQAEAQQQRQEIQRVFNYLDAMAKKHQVSDDERLVMSHQLDRAFRWLQQLADKIGVELKP
jgi:uncharacterized protein HemY